MVQKIACLVKIFLLSLQSFGAPSYNKKEDKNARYDCRLYFYRPGVVVCSFSVPSSNFKPYNLKFGGIYYAEYNSKNINDSNTP